MWKRGVKGQPPRAGAGQPKGSPNRKPKLSVRLHLEKLAHVDVIRAKATKLMVSLLLNQVTLERFYNRKQDTMLLDAGVLLDAASLVTIPEDLLYSIPVDSNVSCQLISLELKTRAKIKSMLKLKRYDY